MSDRRRLASSSSVVPSKRLGLVDGVDDFRLLLFNMFVCDCGDDGSTSDGDVVFVNRDDTDGNNGDDDDGDETTFITGEIMAFAHDDDDDDDGVR
jgi:hypothetical protein